MCTFDNVAYVSQAQHNGDWFLNGLDNMCAPSNESGCTSVIKFESARTILTKTTGLTSPEEQHNQFTNY